MQQPMLGKRIADLRKERGLTQEELVEKCNLNVRTLQRIEAGEVTPRNYTIKIIFSALNAESQVFVDSTKMPAGGSADRPKRLEQVYRYVIDVFNLKTNTMKKISILSMMLIALTIILSTVISDSKAQSAAVKKTIDDVNKNYVRWFNSGQIDSLMTLYRDDACLIGKGCGKTFIRNSYASMVGKFTFQELVATDVTVSESVAVESGYALLKFASGELARGEYLIEWRLTNGKWLVHKESDSVSPVQGH
jgi:transcriptional regulator with XRE-family HTH domain/ketosteroid isomerase-like protein